MKIRGIGRLQRGARLLSVRFQPRVLILLYHRIAASAADPFGLCVTPERFEEQMECLRCSHRVLSLSALSRALRKCKLPARAVVVTFDDGYVDNLQQAKPILERYEVPATVFVTTGVIGQQRAFWWDELARLLFLAPALPATLELSIAGRDYRRRFNDGGDLSSAQASEPSGRTPHTGGASWQQVYRELYQRLQPLGHTRRDAELAQLRDQVNVRWDEAVDGRPMSREEVGLLGGSGLVEIGAHTVTHPVLGAFPREVQRREICDSKTTLEEILGHPVRTFSYPFGGRCEMGDQAPQLVREAGFEVACTTCHTPVTHTADPYRLPRFVVGDWDGDEFGHRLHHYFQA